MSWTLTTSSTISSGTFRIRRALSMFKKSSLTLLWQSLNLHGRHRLTLRQCHPKSCRMTCTPVWPSWPLQASSSISPFPLGAFEWRSDLLESPYLHWREKPLGCLFHRRLRPQFSLLGLSSIALCLSSISLCFSSFYLNIGSFKLIGRLLRCFSGCLQSPF